MIAALILAVLLALAAGWTIGHRTARIRIIPIGALLADDEAALLEDERARFDALVASLDIPNDPRSEA